MSEVQSWSGTAASNNSASPDGWPESMAPSGINNSARENMAAIRRLYGDWNGSLSSGGSSNAYTLSPNRTVSAYAAGIDFLFLANHANTGAATLNVSSLGVKDLKDRNGDAFVGAEIEQYTPVHAVYDNTNGYFRCSNLTAASAGTTPDASETVKGIVELATAAEALTGSSTTLAMTPGGFAGNKSLAANGYYKLPGGFVVQWGSSTVGASTSATVTLPVACANTCTWPSFVIRNTGASYYPLQCASISPSSFGVNNPNAAVISFGWITIGY